MAESSLNSQDLCQCPVCLDPLNDPVTIPCGHSYCMNCISHCWNKEDQRGVYSCPQCREMFSPRPVLKKNTMLAELVGKLKTSETQEVFSAPCLAGPGDVECDFCTERKLKAVKSCLVCLASFCETHVQPHYKSAAFKKHKLVQVSAQLQEKICDQHERLLDVFCRTDQKCICMLCTMDEHRGHDTTSAAAERNEKQINLEKARKKSSQQIQVTEKELLALRQAQVAHKDCAGKAVKQSEIFFRVLIKSIEKCCSEVIKLIRDQEKAAVGQAEKVIKDMEQEIAEKRKGLTQLDQLSHEEDHVHFLQSYQTLHLDDICKDLPSVTFSPNLSFEDPGPVLSALKQKVEKLLLLQMEEMTKQVGPRRRSFVTTNLFGDEICPVCMDEFHYKTNLVCGHAFCKDCLRRPMGGSVAICSICKKSSSVPPFLETQRKAYSSDIKEDTLEDEMQHLPTSTSSDAQDVAAVLVHITWIKEPSLLNLSKLEKMSIVGLQSVLFKTFQGAVIVEKLILDTPNKAKIIICPSKACDSLLDMNSIQLKLKDGSEADMYFKAKIPLEDTSAVAATLKQHESSIQKTQDACIPQMPMIVSVEVNTLKYGHVLGKTLLDKFALHTSGHYIIFKGTFEEVAKFYQQFRQVVGSSVAMNANTVSEHTNPEKMKTSQESMKVPLFQYWYLNHIHKKEIESIEEKHGVKIEADVIVTVKETHGSNSESFTNASQEFMDLFMKCALDITSVPVSSVIQAVKDIQSLDAKLMLSGSAQNWRLVGPRVEVAQAQKMQKDELNNDTEITGGSWAYTEFARGAGGRRAYDSSMDGAASSSLYGQHGHKTGGTVFGGIEGDQPDGTMRDYTVKSPLPGFPRCGTIAIEYNIPSGIQSNKHPKPGHPFRGAQRKAYLPDNKEGREVLELLRRAFNQKLIFTVGTSRTMGTDDCVTWNDVHHKTSTSGGAQSSGYPDDTYLKRVREELKAKGIE